MQDIHSIAGGRIFGGGGSGGDRRLRPHLHHHPNNQALKCPRCDSINTKFCYYNNYNLSQPRHFCKSCRRYWTKGGVLRNVPVGGGCRKTKRSKSKSSQASDSAAATTAVQPQRERKSSSNSSSESSSLTATTTGATTATATTANTTTTATTTAATEAVSATSSISPSGFLNIPEYKSMMSQSMNHNTGFEHELLEQSTDCGLFSEIGNLTSLITSSNDQLPFGFSSVLDSQNQWHQPHKFGGAMCTEQEMKLQQPGPQEIPGSDRPFLDQNVHVDLATPVQSRPSSNGIFGTLDWQPNGDQGFFDLPNAVDQAYWSQTTQWNDVDQPSNLYLP